MLRKFMMLGIAIALIAPFAHARQRRNMHELYRHYGLVQTPLTPDQQRLIQEAIAREKIIVTQVEKSTPVVQTYIQDMRPSRKLYQVPVHDQYMIGRVDFSKAFSNEQYAMRSQHHGFFSGSFHFMSMLTKAFHLENSPTGFMAMMFIDPNEFNQQHYAFQFVRQQFLGTVRTSVFDVFPREKGPGRFLGRIWVEQRHGNIIRFNGTYTNNPNEDTSHYFHFDSWRMNVQPGVWVPASIYVQDTLRNGADHAQSFRGQTTYWGYSLKLPTTESDAESMQIEGAEDESSNTTDVSPLQAERDWISQAEQNVLDRLTQAGLLAPPSKFDKILQTVTNNIIISDNLQTPGTIHCRVLLTEPLESLAVANTILLSKGLIDVLPNEQSLAAVISFQLAQILMGHHIDTRYAFNDRLLFPDASTFQRISMNHSMHDDQTAAKRAMELFDHSVYGSKKASVGLFLEQLVAREKALPALFTPRLGDSLMAPNGQPWLAGLMQGAPKLNMDDLNQVAALPLNSQLKIDPWDDKVYQLHFAPPVLLSARDKMPLEITPVYFKLERYQAPTAPVSTGSAAAPAGQGSPAPAGGAQSSANGQGQASPQ